MNRVVDWMRLWRHDAVMRHLYETAAFWRDQGGGLAYPQPSSPGVEGINYRYSYILNSRIHHRVYV